MKYNNGDTVYRADHRVRNDGTPGIEFMTVEDDNNGGRYVQCRYEDGTDVSHPRYTLVHVPRKLTTDDAYNVLRLLRSAGADDSLVAAVCEDYASRCLVED